MRTKLFLIALTLNLFPILVFGQWTTSGTSIENTNLGDVKINDTSRLYFNDSGSNQGIMFEPIENGVGIGRYALRFDFTNNASYPFLTNRTPSGKVVIKTGTASGGSENVHFTIDGGDGIVNAYFEDANLGIGTTSPSAKLHIDGTGGFSSGYSISNSHDKVNTYFNYNTNDSRYVITYEGTGAAEIELQADGDVILAQAGNVGIGTTTPTNKLEVNGTIRSQEVVVEATGWPDFVFYPDYNLPSLEEVEEYITEHKHLPEVPSEAEVLEHGIKLGEMDATLLQKIEELTLYVIEQNKINKQQQELIEELQAELKSLKEE